MSGLPKTGTGFALAVGGASYYIGAWQIAAIGITLVAAGVLLVRLGWRRNKSVNSA